MKIKKTRSITQLIPYLHPYRYRLITVFISLIITSSSVLGIGVGIQILIDKGFSKSNPEILNNALFVLLGISLALAIATFIRASTIHIICEKVVADIRKAIFNRIIHFTPEFFENMPVSDIIMRLTNDATLISTIITNLLSVTVRNFILFVGGIVFLIKTSPILSLYVLLAIPVFVLPILIMGKKVKNLSRVALEKISDISFRMEESLNGIATVQSFNRENYEIDYFASRVDTALKIAEKRIVVKALLVALVIAGVFGAISFVLWIGGHEVLSGNLSNGELSSFIFYSIVVASSLGAIAEVFSEFQKIVGAIDRIFELLSKKPTVDFKNSKTTSDCSKFQFIEFKNLNFAYPSNKDNLVLKDFNLTISKGEQIAFVGYSGSGKSTIFKLLLRLYEYKDGIITIDNINIKDLDIHNLREYFSLVSQDTVIFSGTIFDNIKYGNEQASDEDVYNAAIAAEVHEFAEQLPEKHNTNVGDKGIKLSGGQKQRIAIARAILKNSPILLLDEATSNLDGKNEYLIQKAISRVTSDRTTIIIAHRISTIINSDRIVVLDKGVIIDIGNHQELMDRCEIYRNFVILNQKL